MTLSQIVRSMNNVYLPIRFVGYDGLETARLILGDDIRSLSDRKIERLSKSLKVAGTVATGLHWLLIKSENS
jgi:hypothetical protein